MQLALRNFGSLVQLQAAAARASRGLIDVSVGSVLRALLEANASVGLWMQWLVMEVLSMTRATTSRGADLDSWAADFGMSRLPAVAASGEVEFGRATPGLAAIIPLGATVRTSPDPDGLIFAVIADPGRPSWTGSGYALGAADASVTVPVRATAAGAAGNVSAGVVRLLAVAIPGVDSAVNPAPMSGGLDLESDAALRERFTGFMDSRTRATSQAVGAAIQSVRQSILFSVVDRYDPEGNVRNGHFTVVVDDGSGAPGAALIASVQSAIEAVRPLGSTYSVVAPRTLQADVAMLVEGPADAIAAIQSSVGEYIASLPIGGWLTVSRIAKLVHDADPRVISVRNITLNGAHDDLELQTFQRAVPGLVEVTLG